MACKHEFIGTAEGVCCSLCGLRLSRAEYIEWLKHPNDGDEKKEAPVEAEKKTVRKTAKKSTAKK